MKERTSIVICTYNEQETIENVVRKCATYNPESELIVVDDGSQDETPNILSKIASEHSFFNIRLEENKGKSHAMVTGVRKASREIIMFFDADVTGIHESHFSQLLEPLKGEADMVLGSPSETLIDYRVNPFKSLTGERALYKKDIEPLLDEILDIRFGVETYLNLYFQANGMKIKYTLLDGLNHPTKYEKVSTAQATEEFLSEGKEIAMALLNNYDLITKSISNSFESQGEQLKDSLKKLQDDINDKVQGLLKNNG